MLNLVLRSGPKQAGTKHNHQDKHKPTQINPLPPPSSPGNPPKMKNLAANQNAMEVE